MPAFPGIQELGIPPSFKAAQNPETRLGSLLSAHCWVFCSVCFKKNNNKKKQAHMAEGGGGSDTHQFYKSASC